MNIDEKILKSLEDLKKKIDSGEIKEKDIKWEKDWFPNVYNAITGRGYSLFNSYLLSSFDPKGDPKGELDPRFLTFKQAKMNGWSIKSGSKGIPIIFFNVIDKFDDTKKKKFDDTKKVKKVIRKKYYLFNASQCEGIPPLENDKQKNIDISLLTGITKDLGIKLNFKDSDRAVYDKLSDAINVPKVEQFKNSQSLYSTFFHELIHSTGAPNRLNRSTVRDYHKDLSIRAKEELTAEIGSVILSKDLNVSYNFSNELNYIYNWSKNLKKDDLIDVVSQAEKAADYLKKLPSFQIYINQIEKSRSCGKTYEELQENQGNKNNKDYKNELYKKPYFKKNQLIQSR